MSTHPETYKGYAFTQQGGKLEKIEIPWKDPEEGEIVAKVLACGVCGSDDIVEEQVFPTGLPRIPGHEIVGTVVAVGSKVEQFKLGDRIGAGWHGGHCKVCTQCLKEDFVCCIEAMQFKYTNGITRDGGYAEYVTLRSECVLHVSEDLDPAETAPLLCAGVTAFNSIRNMGLSSGDLVAVQGIGGIGHLAIQYCNSMGYKTIALSSSSSKRDLALKLGAHEYIDQSAVLNAASELEKLGGANLIVCTAPSTKAIQELLGGLGIGGKLLILALPRDTIELPLIPIVSKRLSLTGWPVGRPIDMEECIQFSKQNGVNCMIEKFPLDKAQEAYDHRASGKLRAVIIP